MGRDNAARREVWLYPVRLCRVCYAEYGRRGDGSKMSLHEYEEGLEMATKDVPFYVLIQAAMRRADTYNLGLLKACWPEVWLELKARYNAPDGLLQSEIAGDKT